MSLTEQLSQAIASIAPFTTGSRTCQAGYDRRQLTCELTALDKLACSVTDLRVTTDELKDASIDRLREIADDLSGRLTYLLEPISPVEVDADRCVVQLRSTQPSREGDANSYYELLVHRGGEIALGRYSAAAGQPRQTVPAQLTQQVLGRLVGDFDAVLDSVL